jgi:hypothetical protein
MSERTEWIVVATFAQVYEAEIAKAILESSGIPAQVLGEHVGVFGPGWAGMAIRGVRLVVPGQFAEEALEVLEEDRSIDEDEPFEIEALEPAEDDDEDEDAPGEKREDEEPWRSWGEWGPGAR